MAEKYITLKREAWETLCGAVKNLSSVSDAINDSGTLATNQTYSNFKINELLTEIETSISDVSDKVDNLEFIDDVSASTDKAFSSQKTTSLINNPYEYVIDSSIYGADILQYSLGHYKVGNNSTISEFTNLPVNIAGMLDVMCPVSGGNQSPWESQYGYRYYRYTAYKGGTYERTLSSGATAGNITEDTGWKKLATSDEVLSLDGGELNKDASIIIDDSDNDLKTTIEAGNIDLTTDAGMGGTLKTNEINVSWINGMTGKSTDDIDFGGNIIANYNVSVAGDLTVGGKDVATIDNIPKVYTDIADLGLSYPQTTRSIFNAMKVGEKAEFTVTSDQLTNMPGHHPSGVLTINKVSTNWGNIQFHGEEECFIAMVVGTDVHWYQIANTDDLPKIYDDALSLTGSTTSTEMKDICYCLSNGETFAGSVTPSFLTDVPDAGFLVVRAFTGGYEIKLLSDNNVIYEGIWKNNVVTWNKITSSNIARTPMNTTTYFPSSTNYTYDGGTGANAVINCFEVKNGICTVNVMVKCVSPVTSFTNIISNLPKNNGAYYNGVIPNYAIGSFGESFLGWRMSNGGTGISLCGGTTGHTYPITFSYPVAE